MRWTFTRSRRPAGGVLAIDHRRLRVTPSPDMTDQTSPFRIAYLTGVYPLASHTFIQREITSLRALPDRPASAAATGTNCCIGTAR